MRTTPYNFVKAPNGDAWVEVEGHTYSSIEISAFVLSNLKKAAEDYLGTKVENVVISVLGHFYEQQRVSTLKVGSVAGLSHCHIIDEPTASAISYRFEKKKTGMMGVVDLGGGTFDVSIINLVGSGDLYRCEVRARLGDTFLGGVDFDNVIVYFPLQQFWRKEGISLSKDVVAFHRLKEAAEVAKKELTSCDTTNIEIPFITSTSYSAKHLNCTLERFNYKVLINQFTERLKRLCVESFGVAGIRSDQVDELLLVGGMSRLPKVEEVVSGVFGKIPSKGVNCEVVAKGACIWGNFPEKVNIENKTPPNPTYHLCKDEFKTRHISKKKLKTT